MRARTAWFLLAVIVLFTSVGLLAVSRARGDGPPSYSSADGDGLIGMNTSYPQPSESGYNWSLSLRYTKQKLLNWSDVEHQRDGHHKTNFLATAMIQDDAVTEVKMAPAVRTKLNNISTNSTSTLSITNALTFYTSLESDGIEVQTSTNDVQTLGSTTIGSNTFTKAMLTAEVYLANNSGGHRAWYVTLATNGAVAKQFGPFAVDPLRHIEVSCSTIVAAGNSASITVSARARSDNNSGSANVTAKINNLRVWFIP